MTVSDTLKQSTYDQQTSDVVLVLLTIDHADLALPIRVVNNSEDVTSRSNTYIAFPFDIVIPDAREDAPSRGRLTIDNVSREIGEAIRTITSPATMTIEVIRSAAPDTVEISWPFFQLRNVKWDAGKVTGDLSIEDFTSEPYPAGIFSPAGFPGLF